MGLKENLSIHPLETKRKGGTKDKISKTQNKETSVNEVKKDKINRTQ